MLENSRNRAQLQKNSRSSKPRHPVSSAGPSTGFPSDQSSSSETDKGAPRSKPGGRRHGRDGAGHTAQPAFPDPSPHEMPNGQGSKGTSQSPRQLSLPPQKALPPPLPSRHLWRGPPHPLGRCCSRSCYYSTYLTAITVQKSEHFLEIATFELHADELLSRKERFCVLDGWGGHCHGVMITPVVSGGAVRQA